MFSAWVRWYLEIRRANQFPDSICLVKSLFDTWIKIRMPSLWTICDHTSSDCNLWRRDQSYGEVKIIKNKKIGVQDFYILTQCVHCHCVIIIHFSYFVWELEVGEIISVTDESFLSLRVKMFLRLTRFHRPYLTPTFNHIFFCRRPNDEIYID